MISVQFGQAQTINKDHYITSAECKLPGSGVPTRFEGEIDLIIKSGFVCLRQSKTGKQLVKILDKSVLGTRRNSKENHFTINLDGNGYIKLGSNISLVSIADLLNKGA